MAAPELVNLSSLLDDAKLDLNSAIPQLIEAPAEIVFTPHLWC